MSLVLFPICVGIAFVAFTATGVATYFGLFAPVKPTPGIEYKDLISILLTAATIVLAVAALGIAIIAVWGVKRVEELARDSAIECAKEAAEKLVQTHLTSDSFKKEVKSALDAIDKDRSPSKVVGSPDVKTARGVDQDAPINELPNGNDA